MNALNTIPPPSPDARRILITGSSGFIGRHLMRTLLAAGYAPWGCDIRPPAPCRLPPPQFLQCDIRDRARLIALVSALAPDAVIHLAARADLNETGNIDGYRANTIGTANLLDAIQAAPSVQLGIFTSTQLVCPIGYIPQSDDEFNPATLYGASKAQMERLIRERDGAGVPWCIVRPTTVWGPGMGEHYRRFLNLLRRGRYFHIGRQPLWKSYGYVKNVAFQYHKILEAPKPDIQRRVFYLADYQPLSLRYWADGFRQELQAPPIRTMPVSVARIAAHAGDAAAALGLPEPPLTSFRLRNIITEYQFDLTPTARVCGPLPYSVDAGIAETARWIQSLWDAVSPNAATGDSSDLLP